MTTSSCASPLEKGSKKGSVFTSRKDGRRNHGRSRRRLSCRHLSGWVGVRKAHGRGRSRKGQARSRHHRHRGEEGLAERRSGRRRSDEVGGSHRREEDLHGAAAGRSGRRGGRRSSEVEGNDGGSRRDEGCSHEEDRDDRSSRPQGDLRDRRGHHSRDRGSRESESGSGAHEDAGSRIVAVKCQLVLGRCEAGDLRQRCS
jgi:hypothetical protein